MAYIKYNTVGRVNFDSDVSTTIYYKSKTAQVTRRFVFDTNTHTHTSDP